VSTVETRELARRLPAGVFLAALSPADADAARLDEAERSQVPRGDPVRRQEFIVGRVAARACLAALGLRAAPLLTRPDGSPAWPASVRGSISHKPGLCVVAAATDRVVSGLGIDVEPSGPLPDVVWATVLSPSEHSRHVGSRGPEDPRVSRLVFSAKEAYYKWHASTGATGAPGFHDVEVDVEGSSLRFSPPESGPEGTYVVGPAWTVAAVWSPAR
jgi:4'-phosphopantetheinyl transferase EntD